MPRRIDKKIVDGLNKIIQKVSIARNSPISNGVDFLVFGDKATGNLFDRHLKLYILFALMIQIDKVQS